MKNAIYTHLQKCPPALELFHNLEQAGSIYLIGGVLREYRDNKRIIKLRDIDIVIRVTDSDVWNRVLHSYSFKINRFGGYKLSCENLLVDIWEIEETWAYRNNIIQYNLNSCVELLPETVFLNLDSIVYDWNQEIWYDKIYQKAMDTRILDIVLEKNPHLLLNIVRTFVLKERYHMQLSTRLKEIILDQLKNVSSVSGFAKILYKEQILRYKSEILSEERIQEELLHIVS